MGQILHGCAKTTEAVCRAIQNSQERTHFFEKGFAFKNFMP